jgi:hypothetical protein
MTSIPASALHQAQQSAKAATAEQALAQVQANQASEKQSNAERSPTTDPFVGRRVDKTA